MLLQTANTIAASLSQLPLETSERLNEALDVVKTDLRSGRSYSIGHYEQQFPEFADILNEVVPSVVALEQIRAKQIDDLSSVHTPRRIGDYAVRGELGRGGMAVVYEAWDTRLARSVALKVLPFSAGLQPISVMRFQHEAQVLAQLDHPHIVPVYNVGEHDGARFLAMKLIEGLPLDDIVSIRSHSSDQNSTDEARPEDTPTVINGVHASTETDRAKPRPPPRAAIQQLIPQSRSDGIRFIASLCVDAARALHAAHNCGIVHRDIKPSNLMLDKDGHIWITDFGLALTRDNDRMTRTGDLLGTVRYMSPEQSRGNRTLMDARSDIYSLGITLYELTTGRAAYVGETCEILNRIESADLIPPRRWDPDFPRDLQNIILKAASKSPDQRYETAAQLADDLDRFLTGAPTTAREPTLSERAMNWLSRRRRTVAAMLTFAAVILAGSLLTTLLVCNEISRTSAALELAEQNFLETQRVVDRFGLQLDSELALIEGTDHVRSKLLHDVIEHYRHFIARSEQSGGLTEDLAITLNKVATLTERVGTPEEALAAHAEAWRAFDALVESDPDNRNWLANRALCDNQIGLLYASNGNFPAAEERYDAAQTTLQRLIKDDQADLTARRILGQTLNNVGLLYVEQADDMQAIGFFADAQDLLQGIVSSDPSDELAHRFLAASFENLAMAHRRISPNKARNAHEESLRLQQQLLTAHPDRVDYRQELAISYDSFGILLSEINDQAEATKAFAHAAEIQRELLRRSPGSPIVLRQLAWSNNRLGQAYARLGHVSDAIIALSDSLEAQQRACDVTANHARDVWTLGGIWNNLGFACEGNGDFNAATNAYRIAVDKLSSGFDEAAATDSERTTLDRACVNLTRMLTQNGDIQEARNVLNLRHQLWKDVPARLAPVDQESASLKQLDRPGT